MSVFDAFPKDEFFFLDANGNKSQAYHGIMSKGQVTFFEDDLCITEGDTAIRILPNSKEEKYKISDCKFQKGMHGIPNHYVVTLAKPSFFTNAPNTVHNVTITNSPGVIIGSNNEQHIDVTIIAKGFEDLIRIINESNASKPEKLEALNTLKSVLNNPTIASLLGGIAGGLFSLIK